jgi:hypothetical protein
MDSYEAYANWLLINCGCYIGAACEAQCYDTLCAGHPPEPNDPCLACMANASANHTTCWQVSQQGCDMWGTCDFLMCSGNCPK